MRHVLTLFDLANDEFKSILQLAKDLKQGLAAGQREPLCQGSMLGLLFEKQSLRTRISFESAIAHLGGNAVFLGAEAGWGKRESIADFGNVLSEYLDVLVFRGNDHEVLVELASHSTCHVINGLTPDSHPCQALADVLTAQELFPDSNPKVTYVGDGNNVARSLALGCCMAGLPCAFVSPDGYLLDETYVAKVKEKCPDADITVTTDVAAGVAGSDVIYTDVWASMGQEAEREARKKIFADYQVSSDLMKIANPDAKFLHCLPARRGEEVTAEVLDGPQSATVQQAGNRMHAQKAVLVWLMKGGAV